MSLYKLVVLIHVLAALAIAASAFGGAVVRAVGKRAPDLAGKVTSLRIALRLVRFFGLPGSAVAGLTGLWMVYVRPELHRAGWAHASIALWVALFSTALLYSLPRLRQTLAAAEASLAAGAPSDELKRLASARAPGIVADLTALGVVVFVVLMVLQPF
jgi:uncharacterized membrane protein